MPIITYPLSLPLTQRPEVLNITPAVAVGYAESPFSSVGHTQPHQGQRWLLSVEYPPMKATDAPARDLVAFLTALEGRSGTFTAGPLVDPRGVATGTPLVKGASQTGNELATDGWTPNVNGILKADDWLQIGVRLHKVLADVNSNGSGEATLAIFPRLRTSPEDNDPINVTNPVGIWRLATNTPGPERDALFFTPNIEAIEVL